MSASTDRVAGRRPAQREGRSTHPVLGADDVSVASRDMDLLEVLAEVQAIAEKAKRIQLDIAAGYAVNGMTGLRQIELAARDLLTLHNHTNGGHR